MIKLIQHLSNENFIIIAAIIILTLSVKLKNYTMKLFKKAWLNGALLKDGNATKYRVKKASISSILILFIAFGISGCANSEVTIASPARQEQLQNHSEGKEEEIKQEENSETGTDDGNASGSIQGELKVHFIDVGQADAILVQQGNHAMMVDAGNNEDGNDVKSYLENQGIKNLDFLVGTHPHEDHIGGLDYIINSFKIGKVYMPKVTSNTKTFSDVVTAVQNKGLTFTTPISGSNFKLGDATCTILTPNGSSYEDLNNYSIVIKVSYGNTSFLLTGDAEDIVENEIITKGYDISSTVLKIGHHGSNSSTTTDFLNKVNPKYAIISVGKDNSYGHPKQNVLDRLKAKGISVYRTDEKGTIIATSDGSKVNFNTQPGSYNGFATSSEKSEEISYDNQPSDDKNTINEGKIANTAQVALSAQPSKIVYWTANGKSYHYDKKCSTLSRSKVINQGEFSTTPKSDPCDICVN